MTRGKYIVIEGPEGTGKTTQVLELEKKLKAAKLNVKIFREPGTFNDLTSRAIRNITQNPIYPINTKTEVLLYNAARSQTLKVIKQSVESGIYCIVDRNYLSTLAIQYYARNDIEDYQALNNIINFAVDGFEPDICLVLDAPPNILKERIKTRHQGERFDDLEISFLERMRAGYLWEAKQRNLPIVYAHESIEKVSNKIWELVSVVLKQRTKQSLEKKDQVVSIKDVIENRKILPDIKKNPYITKKEGLIPEITQEGYDYLSKIITDTKGHIYVFNNEISPVTVAASMARLSRRNNDLRIILLDEFANDQGKDENLLKKVITAYGDDSVQQLTGLHFVIEDSSNLLTKKIEWGRLAAYLEQSTRYIFYDQKDKDNKFKYYTPKNLKPSITKKYVETMDKIFQTYSIVVKKLVEHIRSNSTVPKEERDSAFMSATKAQACDYARALLPVATKSTVGVYASAQALENLIIHLRSDDLIESQETAESLLKEARKIIPMFLERADRPDRGGAIIAYRSENTQKLKKIVNKYLDSKNDTVDFQDVTLTNYFPKNEIDIIGDMLYAYSNLSLEEINNQLDKLSYDQKINIFNTYIGERLNRRQKPGRALELIHYSFDLICDYGIFRDLQRHRIVEDLEWQSLTPRYGYDVPEIINETNLSEMYDKCFDLSLNLHSLLVKNGYYEEAQYATLLGHKMRWKITYNAREAMHLHELRTSPQGHSGYRKLVNKMHEKVNEVHPLMASSMKFVNTAEDPELSRLAAERYTKFKLSKLNKLEE